MLRIAHRGFTMVELLIAITILGIVLAMAVMVYSRFLSAVAMSHTSEEVLAIIREAQERTLAREDGFAYGVHLQSDAAIVFRAPTYTPTDATNEVHDIRRGFRITNISLAGGGTDIIFQPLTGATTPGVFTIEKIDQTVPDTTIRIYESGIANTE